MTTRDHYEEFKTSKITFFCEQRDPPERELKDRLTEYFRTMRSVTNAYLVRASLNSTVSVVLALKGAGRADEKSTVVEISKIFASLFAQGQQLSIMFLSPTQELEINKACEPFFKEHV